MLNPIEKINRFISFIKFNQRSYYKKIQSSSQLEAITIFSNHKLKKRFNKTPKILKNRHKTIAPVLQVYLQQLSSKNITSKQLHAIRKLAYYTYMFDVKFYKKQLCKNDADKINCVNDVIFHYCTRGFKNGIDPSSLFETNSYLTKYTNIKKKGINPLIHFLDKGSKEGKMSMDDIHFMRKTANIKKIHTVHKEKLDQLSRKKIGVFLHIYYPELASLIANYLETIPFKIDLFISTNKDAINSVKSIFKKVKNCQNMSIKSFQNIGRDVAPFIVGFGKEILDYDFILKLHSKKSLHSIALNNWLNHCLDNLIGSEDICNTNLSALINDEVGMVCPVRNYALSLGIKHDSSWGYKDNNYKKAQLFLETQGLKHINRDSEFLFPAGTMFWCKSEILKPILEWGLTFRNFDKETGQIDGTLAHSIERLIGLCCTEISHKKIITSYVGYSQSKQYQNDKKIIETRNQIHIDGFEKVIHFKEQQLQTNWAIRSNTNPKKLQIHWVIPNFTQGLGGHMTIFRSIEYLERVGHECIIWIHSEIKGNKPSRLSSKHKRYIKKYFIDLNTDQVYMLGNSNEDLEKISGDVVIATDRMSAYPVLGMRKFKKRFYFIQDYEPFFFARGTSSMLAEYSYLSEHDFACICASPWLNNLMQEYGNTAITFPLAIDPNIYYQDTKIKRSDNTIVFYIRRSTPRRLYELGILALRTLFDLGDSFELITFGEKDSPDLGIPVKINHVGIISVSELAELYQKSTIGLVLSGTNYSLVPNEMMACGLPVVDIDGVHTRFSYKSGTAILAKPNPRFLAQALSNLLNDQTLQEKVRESGLIATQKLSWDKSNRIIERFIKDEYISVTSTIISSKFRKTSPLVTIVIPVYNGGKFLKKVVKSCLNQELAAEFEILIIDSTSTDGCIDQLPKEKNVRIHHIEKKEFGHGRTRNLGVKLAQGEYVAFITQDAIPMNNMWLMNLIAPLQEDEDVAGVFGCHIAHKNHSKLIAHDIDQHFNRWIFRSHNQPIKLDERRRTSNASIQSYERFYSDNNSCLRKKVWKIIPIPNVNYGEDQLWAIEILRKGFKKAYASTAIVRHSHEYNFRQTLIRAATEWHFYSEYLGEKLPNTKQQVRAMIESSCYNDQKTKILYPEITDNELKVRRKTHFARACGYYLAAKGKKYT
ncbi:rhamnan synthesis F family protein [Synechococcus sp. M16CYN]|uniref:rhamnosyltransferase WsaF family glycosyltransferase n=1 Tax=Synechococcus sp. M16CYN TaxID=3103139 RepID=UPI0032522CD7